MGENNSDKTSFSVYFDPSKTTSGQRFFGELCCALSSEAVPQEQEPSSVLFNVSAPVGAILKAKWNRQKILLRIDGLYSDRLSPAFLNLFRWPLRPLISIGWKYPWAHDFFASLANMLKHNYSAFARIGLADRVIYQSRFSQKVHERYFRKKPYDIIVNGSVYQLDVPPETSHNDGEIRLVTIYDEWKPAKRIQDLVEFVRWARKERKAPVRLTIIGYTGKVPDCAAPDLKKIVETSPYIRTLPRFKSFSGKTREALLGSDIYTTFSYRDPCPNAVVEGMAHGLPVVAVASGGIPDIVGDAGILISADDFSDGFFSPHRYENDFPPIDFDKVLDAVIGLYANRKFYRERVRNRFSDDLGIEIVARRYADVLRTLAGPCPEMVGRS